MPDLILANCLREDRLIGLQIVSVLIFFGKSENSRDNTIGDILIYFTNDDKQKKTFFRSYLLVEKVGHFLLRKKQPIKIQQKYPKDESQ